MSPVARLAALLAHRGSGSPTTRIIGAGAVRSKRLWDPAVVDDSDAIQVTATRAGLLQGQRRARP